ncbi:MAG: methylmalonyl-CoA mutase, partial [Actinobacteria bacterium]|nr:methylmalonyl-CoA mutase [Actinomycetota bacterium]
MPNSRTKQINLDGAEFAAPHLDQWAEIAEVSLRGRSADSLTTTTYDDIKRKALYTAHDQFSTRSDFRRGRVTGAADTSWDIRPIHDAFHPDVNSRILADLEGGATSIHLTNAPNDVDHLADVLAGVHLDMAGVYLDDRAAADALVELWTDCGAGGSATGCLGVDPIGALAITGGLAAPVDDALTAVAMAASVSEHLPNVTAARVDGRPYGEAGASDSTEIACVLSTAIAYLRVLTESGRTIDLSTLNLSFTLTLGPDQFLSIAKLRAARICWAALVSASGGSHRHMPIHATTAEWAISKRDPWINMLRATTAAFAAAVGGADALSIVPFDSAIGHPDELGLRIARNTNFLLGQEAGLDGVTDPAGGSYYVETLTEDMASAAWSKFQDLETRGGIAAALADGSLQHEIALTRAERQAAISDRSDPLTGVSEYATGELTRLDRLPRTEAPELIAGVVDAKPVGKFRAAAPYEELRDAADRYVAATGASPTI